MLAEHVKMCQTLKLSDFVVTERFYCYPYCFSYVNESNAFQNWKN